MTILGEVFYRDLNFDCLSAVLMAFISVFRPLCPFSNKKI